MTTFTTKNQSRKRYYRVLGAVIITLILVALIIWTRRERYKDTSKSSSASATSSNDNRFKNGASGHTHNGRQPFYNDELIEYEPVVLVQGMKIKGQVRTVVNGGTVASYLGIPYAEPPIDDRRFRPPVDKQPSVDEDDGDEQQPETMDAFYQPYKCYQSSFVVSITEIKGLGDESREDCLYLNIWTPFQEDGGCDDCNNNNNKTSNHTHGHTHSSSSNLKPVMIFIHSGLFQYGGIGSPDLDPSLLVAEKQLVAITLQYRLGVFGFGSTDEQSEDERFQSLGLQDQAKALEWVTRNIEKFGGDPNRITLAGHGAGAISIGFHLMHPRTKQLFQRAIVQGVQNIWHIGIYGMNAKSVRFLMEDSNCDDESVRSRDLIGCLTKQRIKPIILLEGQQYLVDRFPVPFVPEFNPWTKRLAGNLTAIPANTKFNDTMKFLELFKDWNIFSPQHQIMIGLNSDDDYVLQKFNKISTKVRFGDQSDEEEEEEEDLEEVDYEDGDADGDADSEQDEGKTVASESKERAAKTETETEDGGKSKPEIENDEAEDKSENEASNDDDDDDGENVNISDEIEVRDTSAEENDNDDKKKMEMKMMETTTMKMETATDDDDDDQDDVLKQHRRRRRRSPKQQQRGRRRRRRQANNINSTLYKLDHDEKIKLCRLVKMYQMFEEQNQQVSQQVLFYRIDPKVLVDVLEEVSFAFGAKSNWLKELDRHTMNVWGSFINDGISGPINYHERLRNYQPKVDLSSVNIINIGQTRDEDNHSQPSIIKFDGTMECPSDSS